MNERESLKAWIEYRFKIYASVERSDKVHIRAINAFSDIIEFETARKATTSKTFPVLGLTFDVRRKPLK